MKTIGRFNIKAQKIKTYHDTQVTSHQIERVSKSWLTRHATLTCLPTH